jgi:hypothetical protein
MMGRSSTVLGLAVSDRAIACAELAIRGDRRTVRRTANFALTPDLSPDQPAALGQALAAFLRQKRFTATRAVVGVPARFLFAVEKELPPADDDIARATLRLQAERLAIAESGEVVCDFVGRTSTTAASRVLLVGMLRQRLERIEQAIDAAGMTLQAVTSSALTLAACAAGAGGGADAGSADGPMLVLARSGAEMVVSDDGLPRMLRHVPFTMNGHGVPPIAPLGPELRRAVTLSPGNSGRELLLVDAVGVPQPQVRELAERLGVGVRSTDGLKLLRIEPPAPASDLGGGEGAIAEFTIPLSLALAGAEPTLLPLDFRHSRLTPEPPRRFSRPVVWGAALAALLVIGVGSLFWTVRSQQTELDQINARLAALKPDLTAAKKTVDRVTYGRGFFPPLPGQPGYRPPILDCLREITLAFRDDERIWANNFTLRESGKGGILAGRAADQKTVRDLSDRLRRNPHFVDVKLQDMREADTRSHEQTFTIAFEFKG